MRDFDSLYSKIISRILTSLFHDTYLGGFFQVDTDRYFGDIVKKITGLSVKFYARRLNNNFPQLQHVVIATEGSGIKVVAGSTESYTRNGRRLANIKAKGEFLERLSTFLPLDLLKGGFSNVAKDMVYAPRHMYARKLFSYGYKKIPSTKVFYGLKNYRTDITLGDTKYQPTTNGGAGHFEYGKAVLSGLLELIQRDAFLVYWLNSISPKKIDVDTYFKEEQGGDDYVYSELRMLVNDFKKYKLSYYFLDITSDIAVPAVCCVLVSENSEGKKVALGASAGFDTCATLLSSATEATSVLNGNYFKGSFSLPVEYIPFKDASIRQKERVSLYMKDESYAHFAFFLQNSELLSVDEWTNIHGLIPSDAVTKSTRNALSYLKELFIKKKKVNPAYEVLVYQVRNRLLKAFDYKVVRVSCEALYSIYLTESYANPEHPRLREFVVNKGFEEKAKLNTWPHPFP